MAKSNADVGLLVLRVGAGGLLALLHGWPKFQRLIDGGGFADPLGVGPQVSLTLAMLAELGCAVLVVLGVLTRWACLPVIFTMFVAAFVVHGSDPIQKKELALMYAIPFITLAFTGPGRWSLGRS
ncbi:MAG: DoxX family protein [Myxococcota bacterium]